MDEDDNISSGGDINNEISNGRVGGGNARSNDISNVDNEITEDDEFDDVDISMVVNLPSGVSVSTSGNSEPRSQSSYVAVANAPISVRAGLDFPDWESVATTETDEDLLTDASSIASSSAMAAGIVPGSTGGAKPSFFFGTSTSFSLRSRKEVAALINAECCRSEKTPELDAIVDKLFNPGTPIDNADNIEWIRWLIAGGRTPQEFVRIGKLNNTFKVKS